MTATESPTVTPTDSRAGTMQPESTLPSSPMSESSNGETKAVPDGEKRGAQAQSTEDNTNDIEGMDTKAKGLMHLLQSSSVSCRVCSVNFLLASSDLFALEVVCCPHVG